MNANGINCQPEGALVKDKCEYATCDLCGEDNTELLLVGRDRYNNLPGEFRVVKCKNCGGEKIIHHKFDRDFVASALYMKVEGINKWLAPVLSNYLFRKTILKAAVVSLSYLGMTSRMTVWVKVSQN